MISRAGRFLKEQKLSVKHALIVSQKEVAVHYEPSLKEALIKEGFEASSFITPFFKSSEAAKSQAVYLKLIRQMVLVGGKNKSFFLVALGGGVVGDLTGFAASV